MGGGQSFPTISPFRCFISGGPASQRSREWGERRFLGRDRGPFFVGEAVVGDVGWGICQNGSVVSYPIRKQLFRSIFSGFNRQGTGHSTVGGVGTN